MTHRQEFGSLVQQEMGKYGLIDSGWDYHYDNAKRRLGLCNYSHKTIYFSLPFVDINTIDRMHNTVLHEIAHALIGPGYGHGYFWKAKAKYIGARPQACNSDPNIIKPKGPYVFNCACGPTYYYRLVHNIKRRCSICKYSDYVRAVVEK